jgi:3-deoxy-D-manno-octulosonic acid kinase
MSDGPGHRAPPGYEAFRTDTARAFVLPGDRPWIEAMLLEHESLYAGARHDEDALALQGRRPVYVLRTPAGPRVVRRYHRGGAVAPLLGDRHLRVGVPRPVGEARASVEARARGIDTPRVVAGVVYPSGPFYRGDLVTEYVDGSVDLAAVLFQDAPGPDRLDALERAGALVAGMAAAGVRHPDLNAKNILYSGHRTLVLDLDRCRTTPDAEPVPPEGMVARLERSLRKLGATTDRALPREELDALRTTAAIHPTSQSDST